MHAVLVLAAGILLGASPLHARDLLVRDARLVDGTGAPPAAGMSVLVRDGRIAAVAPSIAAPAVPILDVAGATVVPGLIDSHIHLGVIPGTEYRQDSDDVKRDLRRAHLRAYLAAGITTVLDTAIDPVLARDVRSWLAAGQPGPEFLILGPPLAAPGGYMSAANPETTVGAPEDVDAALDLVQALGAIGVKVPIERGFGPAEVWPIHSPAVRRAIARGAAARRLPIYVHASAEDEQRIGLELGAHALVHMTFYAEPPSPEFVDKVRRTRAYVMTTFSIMDAELTRWDLARLDDPLFARVVPALELGTARNPESARFRDQTEVGMVVPWLPRFLRGLVASRFAASEKMFRTWLASSMRAAKTLHDAGVPLVIGSDAGNWEFLPYQFHAASTHRELELLAEAGVPADAVLAAATRTAARMLGKEGEIGTVEVGKRADLVVVAGDPLGDVRALRAIRWTIRDGVARTPAEWMNAAAE